MAAVPYYDLAKVKLDLRITDTALDVQLAHWNDEAEAAINSRLTDKAKKARRITSLPVLPYAVASIPEQVQGAADLYVKMRYYEYTKNMDLSSRHDSAWKSKINDYIDELELDRVFYWRIAR